MVNLLVSAGVLVAVLLGLGLVWGWQIALPAALFAGVALYLTLARWVGRRIQGVLPRVERQLTAGHPDEAIRVLESLRPFARYQLGIGRIVDAQIGMVLYAHKRDAERARPYLERAPRALWQAWAMLGAYHYRRKHAIEGAQVFEQVLRAHRKVSLLWAAYAFCEQKQGKRERAIEILATAKRYLPKDQALASNLSRLSNFKQMRLGSYGSEWWALQLEEPPRRLGPKRSPSPLPWRLRHA